MIFVLESRIRRRSLEVIFAFVVGRVALSQMNIREVLALVLGSPAFCRQQIGGNLDVDDFPCGRSGRLQVRRTRSEGRRVPVAAEGSGPDEYGAAEEGEVQDFGEALPAQVGVDEVECGSRGGGDAARGEGEGRRSGKRQLDERRRVGCGSSRPKGDR